MTVQETYAGSDGESTKALYARLEAVGPIGSVALNLFRAQKCSERAKCYRGRGYKGEAYDRKQWSMDNLCTILKDHAGEFGLSWGWKQDQQQEYYPWVLYVDLPSGQVSFHTAARGVGPDYEGDWDRVPGASSRRIIEWVEFLLGERPAFTPMARHALQTSARYEETGFLF